MPAKQPTKKQRVELLREYEATMEANREGYMAYERAHLAMRAGKLTTAKAERMKAEHCEPHRLYWRAYEKARALRKAHGA